MLWFSADDAPVQSQRGGESFNRVVQHRQNSEEMPGKSVRTPSRVSVGANVNCFGSKSISLGPQMLDSLVPPETPIPGAVVLRTEGANSRHRRQCIPDFGRDPGMVAFFVLAGWLIPRHVWR
jgi:hypothetical protein